MLHVRRSLGSRSGSTLVCDRHLYRYPLNQRPMRLQKVALKRVKHLVVHQTARPFNNGVWTDSSSAKAIMQRLGPGRRAKHSWVETMWVQQLAKVGLISLNKLNTLENVADLLTKHVPRTVLDKLAGMMGYRFLVKKIRSFRRARASIRITRRSSTMVKMKSWRMMFAVLWTKRPISRQPFSGGC